MDLTPEDELLVLNERLLESIDNNDYETYTDLCDVNLSAFEPEAMGQLVEGLPFHAFYLMREGSGTAKQSTICSPRVRMLGDGAAVVTFVRLVQTQSPANGDAVSSCEETRVWHKVNGQWKHVHFHRSFAGSVELG